MTDADNEDTQGVIIMPDTDNEDTQDVIIKPITVTAKEYAQSYEFAPLNEPLGAIVRSLLNLRRSSP
jgi:hypothetical protein